MEKLNVWMLVQVKDIILIGLRSNARIAIRVARLALLPTIVTNVVLAAISCITLKVLLISIYDLRML